MRVLLIVPLLMALAWPARGEPPKTDLTLELRQIEAAGAGYTVGTRPTSPLMPPQQLRVRNGAQVRFSMGQAMPLQWVQSVTAGSAMSGPSVKQGLIWMHAGQRMALRPNWPGGKQPVTVEVEVQSASVEERPGADLPTQARGELATTVQAPLGEWVTIARSGNGPAPGTYRSDAASQSPRLLQLRVSQP